MLHDQLRCCLVLVYPTVAPRADLCPSSRKVSRMYICGVELRPCAQGIDRPHSSVALAEAPPQQTRRRASRITDKWVGHIEQSTAMGPRQWAWVTHQSASRPPRLVNRLGNSDTCTTLSSRRSNMGEAKGNITAPPCRDGCRGSLSLSKACRALCERQAPARAPKIFDTNPQGCSVRIDPCHSPACCPELPSCGLSPAWRARRPRMPPAYPAADSAVGAAGARRGGTASPRGSEWAVASDALLARRPASPAARGAVGTASRRAPRHATPRHGAAGHRVRFRCNPLPCAESSVLFATSRTSNFRRSQPSKFPVPGPSGSHSGP
ncbi:unnamed protein product [Prorocentrum cordatum]|uniref:Uncharacterized protein n=1 Tax=Prorocentrum cordatum TaxID=2364126 RepID=A0ABN9Y7C3_9DINO|nr:unnamed protein product [Polarella glacialis]